MVGGRALMLPDELWMMVEAFEHAINEGRHVDALELSGALMFKLLREQGMIPPKAVNSLQAAYSQLLDTISNRMNQEGNA